MCNNFDTFLDINQYFLRFAAIRKKMLFVSTGCSTGLKHRILIIHCLSPGFATPLNRPIHNKLNQNGARKLCHWDNEKSPTPPNMTQKLKKSRNFSYTLLTNITLYSETHLKIMLLEEWGSFLKGKNLRPPPNPIPMRNYEHHLFLIWALARFGSKSLFVH